MSLLLWHRWADLTRLARPTAGAVLRAAQAGGPRPVFDSERSLLLYLGGNVILKRDGRGEDARALGVFLLTPAWRGRLDIFRSHTPIEPAALSPALLFGVKVPCSRSAMWQGLVRGSVKSLVPHQMPDRWEIVIGGALTLGFYEPGDTTGSAARAELGYLEFDYVSPRDGQPLQYTGPTIRFEALH